MKGIIKKIFYSENFKRAMVNLLYTNPRLTGAEYLELSKIIKEIDNNKSNENMEMRKAS